MSTPLYPSTSVTAPAPMLALAGLALLIMPKAVKTIAFGALGLYGFQLFKLYRSQGAQAVAAAATSAYKDAQSQMEQIQRQELSLATQQVSSFMSEPTAAPAVSSLTGVPLSYISGWELES